MYTALVFGVLAGSLSYASTAQSGGATVETIETHLQEMYRDHGPLFLRWNQPIRYSVSGLREMEGADRRRLYSDAMGEP